MKIYQKDDATRVHVYVQPRAARTEIVGEHGDAVKIRLTAPPVEGAANEELTRFMAKLLGTAPSHVRVVAGETSRQKVVEIADSNADAVSNAIKNAMKSRD